LHLRLLPLSLLVGMRSLVYLYFSSSGYEFLFRCDIYSGRSYIRSFNNLDDDQGQPASGQSSEALTHLTDES
jgi:hypothetical protein